MADDGEVHGGSIMSLPLSKKIGPFDHKQQRSNVARVMIKTASLHICMIMVIRTIALRNPVFVHRAIAALLG